ncbi:LA2681 family HEPN domain-containing protein [Paremcibacter congregatus]|uniref:LA2681 family HEPN domain-containing protein n=1 Tax=Paremcibacter congregatus TaxID=2043170 RepID=UPI003A914978
MSDIYNISRLIEAGRYEQAIEETRSLLGITEALPKCDEKVILFFNLAGFLVDIGAEQPNQEAAEQGLELFTEHEEAMKRVVGDGQYFYNLGNAKSNFLSKELMEPASFHTIEQLVEVKNIYWKAVKYWTDQGENCPPEYLVNLGNILKRQYRLTEALSYYDLVLFSRADIPQAWLNRSETLVMLNRITTSYSIQMFEEVKKGFEAVVASTGLPPAWIPHYERKAQYFEALIEKELEECGIERDADNDHRTQEEFSQLSPYRQFCLQKELVLSEHALYCPCAGSARDNLSIITRSGLIGDFIIPMEMVLNRLKSEFSLARRLYYEYGDEDASLELLHETCFTELYNDEVLGLDVEKLRTSFRLCFGMLDKIGVAICELLGVFPKGGDNIYFQNFWRLDTDGRRDLFEKHSCPSLLALYSIATDLNSHKGGEWAFYKTWRNDLEHKFVVVYKSDTLGDLFGSYKMLKEIIFIREDDFVNQLEHLLRLTRSAIFSFAYLVREKALKETSGDSITVPHFISPQDYVFDDSELSN